MNYPYKEIQLAVVFVIVGNYDIETLNKLVVRIKPVIDYEGSEVLKFLYVYIRPFGNFCKWYFSGDCFDSVYLFVDFIVNYCIN